MPNIVVILADDAGYADMGVYGAEGFETPNMDRMAAEGARFSDFYVAQPVCGASRAALLTGCYPDRIGMFGAPSHKATHGISDDEMTIADVLKQENYATAAFGKWHLGHHPQFLPLNHGFDEYFGLPYSNDMWPHHPTGTYPPLPLIEGDKIINPDVTAEDQRNLTTWYTEKAVDFINRNQASPFFLYVAHSMPHVPLFVSDKFKGKSEKGLYGDVLMEIDWSVGEILQAIKDNGLDDDTLVIYTSDNGPWLSYGNHGGSAGPLREGKATTWDGGTHVHCVMRWPGKIPSGSECTQPAMTIDLLPTFAELADCPLPPNTIDGRNIWPLISGKSGARSPHEAYYFYWREKIECIRSGKWKLHFPHPYRSLKRAGEDGMPGEYIQKETDLALYNLNQDISEENNLAGEFPEVVDRLETLAENFDRTMRAGKRPRGTLK